MTNSTKYIFYDSEIEAMKRDITISKKNDKFNKIYILRFRKEIEAIKRDITISKKNVKFRNKIYILRFRNRNNEKRNNNF